MDDVHLKQAIPEGEYVVEFVGYYTTTMFAQRTPKLCMQFGIVEGDFAGIPLEQFHTVDRLYGDAGPKGSFKPKGQTCKLMIEFCRCFHDQKIDRLDRIPMSRWESGRFIAKVRTVSENHQRTDIPNQLRYSVIAEILGVAAEVAA